MEQVEARAPWADRKPPLLAKMIALGRHVYWQGWLKTSIRAPYGEVSFGKIQLGLELGNFGRPHLHVALPGVQVFFRLPRWRWLVGLTAGPNSIDGKSYGFCWRFGHEWQGDIHCHWGSKFKIISMPWGINKRQGDYLREYLGVDGGWHDFNRCYPYDWKADDGKGPHPVRVSKPYPYLTDYGNFQDDITATAHMERTHRVYRVFGFATSRKITYEIGVDFDKEVGSERGSWKGGTVGCHYAMKPGETIEECLLRMRRERRFCR